MYLSVLSLALLFAGGNVNTPEDLDKTFQSLKQAADNNDAVQVKSLALQTYSMAQEIAVTPAPATGEEKESWKQETDYAKYVELQTEYTLSAAAATAKPADTVDLLSTLERLNPASKIPGSVIRAILLRSESDRCER